ncbi:uncharacterized protein EV422DRAFT_502743 [Fimicolochytrium jonesii]|uniref:uncharacterized protein n=1 Tax=Fimicolochytrium jonesii TaxID=1396493 RepID=UPI0022FE9B01|nr:uncharacterized protein EV422DRAFT_502743 [Fimicolochytrium jonesii]KAI8827025.1 hypothetical protein EV422DRAFT_502743 [Fimicolochytrium jonesii]
MQFTTLAILALTAFTGVSASAIDAASAKHCKIAGCSAELCLPSNAEPGVSGCVQKPEYECFKTATCQYNAREQSCNWKMTPKLTKCIETKTAPATKPTPLCKVTGCSGELCVAASSPDRPGICIYKPEFACFKTPAASCEFDNNTQSCGWAKSDELNNCITQAKADADVPKEAGCKVAGCNSELCVPKDSTATSSCAWKPEFECFKKASCGYINKSLLCGWKSEDTLTQCIKEARLGA